MTSDQSADSQRDQFPFVRVFGGIGVEVGGEPVSIGGPRQRRLLALLVVRTGSTVSLDWLAEQLWDDDERPKQTTPPLYTYLSRLRAALPSEARDWLETNPSGYRFTAPLEAVEHLRFSMLRAEATRAREIADPQSAEVLLNEALALWRGDPFPELEDIEVARADIERLALDRLEMMEERWEAVLALGRHTQVTGELAAFTAEHRLRDRAARQYALALHRSGRTTEALRVIAEHRATLADQSGLEPSADLVELEQALLNGDASLTVEQSGRPLRGYRLLEEIGNGAFSIVWRGIQPSVNREVAVKQIRSELATQPDFIRRFEAEAQLVARIGHPHVVPMIDFWRDPDSAYLVMQWLQGGTLERRLQEGPLTVGQSMTLANQIGGALAAAHARGVIHRDVKTSNILFDENDHAFLTDFGIAIEMPGSGHAPAVVSQGSPAYASPEQIRREPLGPSADIFSFGVVLFECLSGSLPFSDSTSLDQLIDRQLHTPYPNLSQWRQDLPAALCDAIANATEKDVDSRFASVDEFLEALTSDPASPSSDGDDVQAFFNVVNPYKGLRAFDPTDAFFGRERLTQEMIDQLAGADTASRCLVVVGPSGSGKSSVVRAGVVPALQAGAVEGSEGWFTSVMVPGFDPYESLEAALLRIAVNPPTALLRQLRDGERGVLRGIRRCLESEDNHLLLVIDQFEEIFIGESSAAADAFLDALAVAVEDQSSPLRLVITLRADYYHRPLEHPAFAKILKASSIDVTPMTGDELEQAIVEPASSKGVAFETGLVPRIVADTAGQASPLPLLQFTLSELFEQRSGSMLTVEDYQGLGGLSGALASQAEGLFWAASDAERSAIRRVFGRMTNAAEQTADLRRRVPLGDLGDDPATRWVLDRFGEARLITFDRDVATREPTVEVAHEALLREWPRLVEWLSEDLEVLRLADAIGMAASSWEEGERQGTDLYRGRRLDAALDVGITAPDRLRPLDMEFVAASREAADAERQIDQRRVRRLRRLVAGVGTALVLALVAGGFAVRQAQRANDEASRADVAAGEAAAQASLAEDQATVAEEQTVVAELQAEVAEEQTAAAVAAAEQSEVATLISRSAAIAAEDPTVSILLALEANRRSPGPEAEQAVLSALGSSAANRISSTLVLPDHTCSPRLMGESVFVVGQGEFFSGTWAPPAFNYRGRAPERCVDWAEDELVDRRWAHTRDGFRLWLGPFDGDFDIELAMDHATFVIGEGFTAAGHLAAWSDTSEGVQVGLRDNRTGDWIGVPTTGGERFEYGELSPDGSMVAISVATSGASGADGQLLLLDGITGAPLHRVATTLPVVHVACDSAIGELVAALSNGQVVTIDLTTGEVISTVSTTTTSRFLDLRVRPDGLIVAVSQSQVEFVDRSTGPVRRPIQLRNAEQAFLRSDGFLTTLTSTDRFEVFDLDSGPLIEQAIEVDAFSSFTFNDGHAAAAVGTPGRVEQIDLRTEEHSSSVLTMQDGGQFDIAQVFSGTTGLWAASTEMVVANWSDDQLVEQFELGGSFVMGNRYDDLWAILSDQPEGRVVDLIDLSPGAAGVAFRVEAPDADVVHPSLDGGLHVISFGRIRTYDPAGNLTEDDLINGGPFRNIGRGVDLITLDPISGLLALSGSSSGVGLLDPVTAEVIVVPVTGVVANLGFVRNGELLTITSSDGTVRLWDIERAASAGVVWTGTGAVSNSAPWDDDNTMSVWVASSGKLLQIPLDPDVWLEQACTAAGRNLTLEEWDRFVPGDHLLWFSCTDEVDEVAFRS